MAAQLFFICMFSFRLRWFGDILGCPSSQSFTSFLFLIDSWSLPPWIGWLSWTATCALTARCTGQFWRFVLGFISQKREVICSCIFTARRDLSVRSWYIRRYIQQPKSQMFFSYLLYLCCAAWCTGRSTARRSSTRSTSCTKSYVLWSTSLQLHSTSRNNIDRS